MNNRRLALALTQSQPDRMCALSGERRIVALRLTYVARSPVGKVLAIYRMPRLACLDQGTGLPDRKPTPQRYEPENPGGIWSTRTSRSSAAKRAVAGTAPWGVKRTAKPDIWLAYSKILGDETKPHPGSGSLPLVQALRTLTLRQRG